MSRCEESEGGGQDRREASFVNGCETRVAP